MDALRLLKSFSPEEKEFLQTEKITAEKTLEEWTSFLKKALLFDKKADSKRKKLMALAILPLFLIPIIMFLVFVILALIVPENSAYEFEIAIFVFFLTIISGLPILAFSIYKFVQYFKLRKFNIKSNHRIRSKALPVLSLLREEVNPNQEVKLQLDLRSPTLPEKFVGKSPAYEKGVYYSVVDSDYKNNWINGETFFADGTLLIWSITDLIRQQKKTKRNFRGKYKTKYKNKNKTFISLQAGLERKKYVLPPKLKQKGAEGAIRTKKQGNRNWIQIKRTFKHGVNDFNIRYLIDTIASVYMRAKPNMNR